MAKRNVVAFPPKFSENSLEKSHQEKKATVPNASSGKLDEKPLELARRLCLFANAGTLRAGTARVDAEREVRVLLGRTGWDEDIAFADLTAFDPRAASEISAITQKEAVKVVLGEWPVERMIRAGQFALLRQCMSIAERLAVLVAGVESSKPFMVERRELVIAALGENGHVDQSPVAPLGPYQKIFELVLDHHEIDKRRFARCANQECKAFFYKPRLRSQACGSRCENALRARRHYYREKTNRERALELCSQGKSVVEIARELGVGIKRVRRYIKSKRRGLENGTQKKRG